MATSVLPRMVTPEVVNEIIQGAKTIETRIHEGRFQSWLALVAGLSSALSGVEVALLHYRGSYSRRIMYTPVILSVALLGAGVTAFRSRRAAKTALPAISALTLADCVVGSYFHVRGIQRKPGGWRLPLTNIAMGPPIFAPLLFGTSAYLGILASFLRRDDDPESVGSLRLGHTNNSNGWAKNLHEGRFQKHLAVVTALSASCSGFEAFYSHYKNNFRYKAQWTPVLLAPLLAAIWQRVPVHRFWTMLVEDCVEAYYAHPWAWDEIGFGGPAYPRGYIRLENGSAEPWESDEKRYEWKAPANSVSDLAEPIPSSIQHPAPHQ